MIKKCFSDCGFLARLFSRYALLACISLHTVAALCESTGTLQIVMQKEQVKDELTYIYGVGARTFEPDSWTSAPPHLVADVRHPLLEPQPGAFRNIYAPSALADGNGWTVFYGGWDGISEGKDHIYALHTRDFRSFNDRRAIINPGPFQHVCNVNAQHSASGVTLMCTAYPDSHGFNKPSLFNFSFPLQPIMASHDNLVHVNGYAGYGGADINGMNVLLRDDRGDRLYFSDFKNFGTVFVADRASETSTTFELTGEALREARMVNDVKKLRDSTGEIRYLMGLHENGGGLRFAVSKDGAVFTSSALLLNHRDAQDRYITSVGFVTDCGYNQAGNVMKGVLYGAGAAPTLDANRIFARWLQDEVRFSGDGPQPEIVGSRGPDCLVVELPAESWTGYVSVSRAGMESTSTPVSLRRGLSYAVK